MTTRKENRKRRQKQFKKDLIDQFLATSDLEEQSKQPDLELKAEYFQLSVMLSIPPTHILNRYYVHDSQGNCYGQFMTHKPDGDNWQNPANCFANVIMQRKYKDNLHRVEVTSCGFVGEKKCWGQKGC